MCVLMVDFMFFDVVYVINLFMKVNIGGIDKTWVWF